MAVLGSKQFLMQRSDGAYLLILSNEQNVTAEGGADISLPTAVSTTVVFKVAPRTVNLYDPMKSASIQQTFANLNEVAVSVPAHPIVLEIIP